MKLFLSTGLISLLLICGAQTAHADGFALGSKFVSHDIYGDVTVFCNGGGQSSTAYYSCHENILDPLEQDYFTTTDKIDATHVELITRNENKEVKQKRAYNSEKQTSEKRFNLWISTLLQTPLLNYGENTVFYRVLKNDIEVKAGEFKVQVETGANRRCRHSSMNSFNPSDCSGGGSFVCSRYFEDENYCQD